MKNDIFQRLRKLQRKIIIKNTNSEKAKLFFKFPIYNNVREIYIFSVLSEAKAAAVRSFLKKIISGI